MARRCGRRVLLAPVLFVCAGIGPPAPPPGDREPQWPLKSSRTLLTDEQIARARRLCETDKDAAAVREKILREAEYWLGKPDEQLREVLPDSRVPRAFDVSVQGCPRHGKDVFRFGTYPWILDRDCPFTLICPVGGETYPSNDFEAYYRTGMADDSLLTGAYADPGRGWVAPDGEKFWLVAHACHWNWRKTWLPAVTALSRAYVLTGDRTYARKALAMLDRIAEIYPGMDHAVQSRYGELTGGKYPGKIINAIWETGVLRDVAVAYDMVFDALVGNDPVRLPWRSAEQVRENIDANLLEEGIDAVARYQIYGNFGMHQDALACAVVVRQNGPTSALLDGILTKTGEALRDEGLNYALYNLVFKDGMPYESAPGYCFLWVDHLVLMSRTLRLAGIDLYRQPKMKLLFDAPLDMICAGGFTPAIGDAGKITDGWIGPSAYAYEDALRHLGGSRYAWALDRLGGLKSRGIADFDNLLEEPLPKRVWDDAAGYRHRPRSRLLDGYGLAVLNNAADSVAVSMYYGIRGGHGHFDRLNIELFAHGRRLSPDLGYPDFMNVFVPGIYSWSQNTISHNCIVVDRSTQRGNLPGRVLRFHDSPTVHVVDVDGVGSYPQADVYRRTLVLVDVGPSESYLVDVVRVRGGTDHVLSLHGPEAGFELLGGDFPAPVTEGTLAGREVAYGQLYDDPVLGAPGYTSGYHTYSGSGYQHLFNWQRATPDQTAIACWKPGGSPAAGLRVHVPPYPGQELIAADAYVSPNRMVPTILKYVLVRREGGETGNTFVAVWEPFADKPLIDTVDVDASPSLGTGHNRVVALTVRRGSATDTIVVAPEAGRPYSLASGFSCDAAVVATTEEDGRPTRTFAAGGSTAAPATIAGELRTVDYAARRIAVNATIPPAEVAALAGCSVRIFNDSHSCVYRVAAARVDENTLTIDLAGSDVFTGRIRVGAADAAEGTVSTPTIVLYPYNLAGMRLVTPDLNRSLPIQSMVDGVIQLRPDACEQPFAGEDGLVEGADAWIADFGPGDRVEIERFVHSMAPP